jgi:hypothetical protein
MDSDLVVVVGRGVFRFPNVAQAAAARDWVVYNSIRYDEFRARYPDIPFAELPCKTARPVGSLGSSGL